MALFNRITSDMVIREAAVAGMFYPDNPEVLKATVADYLSNTTVAHKPPKALIVPHAGYIYSGPVAASAYASIKPIAGQITKVVLIGPSHYVGFSGLAASHADAFSTPLGTITLDRENIERALTLPQVSYSDMAHTREHCLEVQLPFLQTILNEFQLTPLVAGKASAEEVSDVLELLWGGPETLIVISSDLSHYYSYYTAKDMDQLTSAAIEALDGKAISHEQACGRVPIQGLLYSAKRHHLQATTLDLRNSGDTAGPKDRVVGYGAYHFR
jgi:hypothetical protein